MNKIKIGIITMGLLTNVLMSNETNTAVTIYNSGSGVVNEIRQIELKKGIQDYSITDVAEKLNPATVKISLNNAQIIEQNFKYDLVNSQKIMNKYIGQEITLIGKNTITGKLLSAAYNNIVIQKSDGGLIIISKLDDYQISVGKLPDGFVLQPTLVWKINSSAEGKQNLDLIYQTDGLTWNAEYVALVNESDTKLDLSSWISLDNSSGKTYNDAKLKLIAGDINRQSEPNVVYGAQYRKASLEMAMDQDMTTEKSFFEYHMYTVANPTTLANNEKKQVSMFDKYDINCKKIFKYESHLYNNNSEQNPDVAIEFINSKENNMGIPLPMGVVRVFKTDGADKELIGESSIKHTPKDEQINLNIGKAFDIVIKEYSIKENRISDRVMEIEYELEIRNRKTTDIELVFQKNLYASVELLKSDIEPFDIKANYMKFKIPVKKDETKKMKYKIRITS